jgi:hypothetical protein
MKNSMLTILIFTGAFLWFLPTHGQFLRNAPVSIKGDIAWPIYATTQKGLTALHFEGEINDSANHIGLSLIANYLRFDGLTEVDIWLGNPPLSQVTRNEFAAGIGFRCYPFSWLNQKYSKHLGFFVEPQFHLQILNDTISYEPFDYYKRNQGVFPKVSIKGGYQKIISRWLLIEPVLLIRYFPDYRYFFPPQFTFNLMVGYRFQK